MTLADRISTAKLTYKSSFLCKLMSITKDPKLSKEDINALISVINSNPLSEDHVPNTRLAYALREEGYDISSSSVDRHRRKDCACYRTVLGE
jgi:hypothetical protein